MDIECAFRSSKNSADRRGPIPTRETPFGQECEPRGRSRHAPEVRATCVNPDGQSHSHSRRVIVFQVFCWTDLGQTRRVAFNEEISVLVFTCRSRTLKRGIV